MLSGIEYAVSLDAVGFPCDAGDAEGIETEHNSS